MIRILFALVLLFTLISGCSTEDSERISTIHLDILPQLIDSVNAEFQTEMKTFKFDDPYEDAVKVNALTNIYKYYESDKSERLKMLYKLIKDSVSTISIQDSELKVGSLTIISNRIKIRTNKIDGLLNLSKVVMSENSELACFYFAIQCGEECGIGYVVYVKRENEKWSLDSLLPVWSTKQS